MSPALLFALQLLNSLPSLISTGQSVMLTFQQHRDALEMMIAEKRDPTPAEWDALNAHIADLRAQLHAPKG